MRFLIVSHVLHKKIGDRYFAYGPYVKEMNLWLNHVEEVLVLAPLSDTLHADPIDLAYEHHRITFFSVPEIDLLSWQSKVFTLFKLPFIFAKTISAMLRADHIHLRCPGNMGLIGAVTQIFFPWKKKTAKYAGNWDPDSQQPTTYRLQQKIISNPSLSQNMRVLVYGDWSPSNKNLLSFFTASYRDLDKVLTTPRVFTQGNPIHLIFVGSLHSGKNPMISCETAVLLQKSGIEAHLDLYGEGPERERLEKFINVQGMNQYIHLHGNVNSEILQQAYKNSHFLVFASESEGWPKAVAEAMFWACLPLTTSVSCVPQMIGEGSRGELVAKDARQIASKITHYLDYPEIYQTKCRAALNWSREFTLEKFEVEIQKLLKD